MTPKSLCGAFILTVVGVVFTYIFSTDRQTARDFCSAICFLMLVVSFQGFIRSHRVNVGGILLSALMAAFFMPVLIFFSRTESSAVWAALWAGLSYSLLMHLGYPPLLTEHVHDQWLLGVVESAQGRKNDLGYECDPGKTGGWLASSPGYVGINAIREAIACSAWLGVAIVSVFFIASSCFGHLNPAERSIGIAEIAVRCIWGISVFWSSYLVSAIVLVRKVPHSFVSLHRSAELMNEILHIRGFVFVFFIIQAVAVMCFGALVQALWGNPSGPLESALLMFDPDQAWDHLNGGGGGREKIGAALLIAGLLFLSAFVAVIAALAVSLLAERAARSGRSGLAADVSCVMLVLADSMADLLHQYAFFSQNGAKEDSRNYFAEAESNRRRASLAARLAGLVRNYNARIAVESPSPDILKLHGHAWWLRSGFAPDDLIFPVQVSALREKHDLDLRSLKVRWQTPSDLEFISPHGCVVSSSFIEFLDRRLSVHLGLMLLNGMPASEVESEVVAIRRVIFSKVDWVQPSGAENGLRQEARLVASIAAAAAFGLSGAQMIEVHARTSRLVLNGNWKSARTFARRAWFALLFFDPVARNSERCKAICDLENIGRVLHIEDEASRCRSAPENVEAARWCGLSDDTFVLDSDGSSWASGFDAAVSSDDSVRYLAMANLMGRVEMYEAAVAAFPNEGWLLADAVVRAARVHIETIEDEIRTSREEMLATGMALDEIESVLAGYRGLLEARRIELAEQERILERCVRWHSGLAARVCRALAMGPLDVLAARVAVGARQRLHQPE